MNANGNNSDSVFLEVKIEPTEIFYTPTNVPIGKFKNESSSDPIVNERVKCFTSRDDMKVKKIDPFPSGNPLENSPPTPNNKPRKPTRSLKCDVCHKAFKWRSNVIEHMKLHTGEKTQSCPVCAKTFKTRCNMSAHAKRHTDERNHKCDVCGKTYKLRKDVVRHMEQHSRSHLVCEKNHRCCVCAKDFRTRRNMLVHMRCHTDERNHKCATCGKGFKTRRDLAVHVNYHSDERKYDCEICGKSFKTRSNKTAHRKSHSERSHKCGVCGKGFKARNDVVVHMKRHTDERNYKCQVCTKGFKTKNDLSIHMKCHGGEKNRTCGVCGRSFKTRNDFVRHMEHQACGSTGRSDDDIQFEDHKVGYSMQKLLEERDLNVKEEVDIASDTSNHSIIKNELVASCLADTKIEDHKTEILSVDRNEVKQENVDDHVEVKQEIDDKISSRTDAMLESEISHRVN